MSHSNQVLLVLLRDESARNNIEQVAREYRQAHIHNAYNGAVTNQFLDQQLIRCTDPVKESVEGMEHTTTEDLVK